MTNNRGKFMRISVDLLDMIDYSKPYETQLALTLLYKGQALYEAWNDTLIETTASLLIKTFKKQEVPRRQADNVVNALVDMRDRGMIEFDEDDIKFKDEIVIDVKPLIELANSGEVYVELLVEDFYAIMESDNKIVVNKKEVTVNGIESYLLQSFITTKARWNFKTIDMLSEVDDFNYAIGSYEEVQQAKGVFCSDSLDYIRTHKHYALDEIDNWCDDRYLMAYLEKLVELDCIKIYKRKMKTEDGISKTKNFYYIPTMSFECIDAMVRQYARRHNYVIKQSNKDKVEEKPISPITRGGKRKRVNW